MKPIVIPPYYVHTRSTPFWTRDTAPPAIWSRHLDKGTRQGVYPRLCVMRGVIRYCAFANKDSSVPSETLTMSAGQFGIFPPETWHCIEALSQDVLFNVDFFVDPQILLEE